MIKKSGVQFLWFTQMGYRVWEIAGFLDKYDINPLFARLALVEFGQMNSDIFVFRPFSRHEIPTLWECASI